MSDNTKPSIPADPTKVNVSVDPAKVAEFLKTHGVPLENQDGAKNIGAPEVVPEPPKIQSDPVASDDSMAALRDTNILERLKVTITDEDRSMYQDGLFTGGPVKLNISFKLTPNGRVVTAVLRERSIEEYDLAYLAVNEDQKKGQVSDYPHFMWKMQQYMLAMQMLQFNKSDVPPFTIPVGALEQKILALRETRDKKIVPMTESLWLLWLHAYRIFERKHQLLQQEMVSGDFSEAAD